MKTILYRVSSADATSEEGWDYYKLRCFSDKKVTIEDCIRDRYGSYYLNNMYNKHQPDILVEILKEIEDEPEY